MSLKNNTMSFWTIRWRSQLKILIFRDMLFDLKSDMLIFGGLWLLVCFSSFMMSISSCPSLSAGIVEEEWKGQSGCWRRESGRVRVGVGRVRVGVGRGRVEGGPTLFGGLWLLVCFSTFMMSISSCPPLSAGIVEGEWKGQSECWRRESGRRPDFWAWGKPILGSTSQVSGGCWRGMV